MARPSATNVLRVSMLLCLGQRTASFASTELTREVKTRVHVFHAMQESLERALAQQDRMRALTAGQVPTLRGALLPCARFVVLENIRPYWVLRLFGTALIVRQEHTRLR